MSRSVTIHIGLPSAGGAVLQSEFFTKAKGLNYLGRGAGDRAADAALRNLGLLGPTQLNLAALRADFASKIARSEYVPLVSSDLLSTWKSHSPLDLGERMAAVFGPLRVICITRRPAEWAVAQYQTRVLACQRDTFAGINPWLEKHLSQLKVGSDLAAAAFAQTLDAFCEGSCATDVLVAPYEEFEGDSCAFLERIDGFLALDGALMALAGGATADLEPPSKAMLNYARVLALFDRDRPRFLDIADTLAAGVPRFFQKGHQAVRQNPEARLEDWIHWFRNTQRAVFRAIGRGNERLAEVIDIFPEAPVRDGLLAHLAEIEAQETEAMLARRGVDLRPFGYVATSSEPGIPELSKTRGRINPDA